MSGGVATSTMTYSDWKGRIAGAPPTLHWRAGLAGRYRELWVDGKPVPASVSLQEGDSRLPVSWVNVTLAKGDTVRVTSSSSFFNRTVLHV